MRLVPSFLRTILPFVRQFPLLKFAFVPPLSLLSSPTFLYPFSRAGKPRRSLAVELFLEGWD